MRKRLCVLQVTPEKPNPKHKEYFNTKDCDFYFVTHDSPHHDALKFCPNTKWAETRNILVELVPKNYDYYAFIDHDYIFKTRGELSPMDQMLEDLEHNPAVLTYYPGKTLKSEYATDEVFLNSRDYSCIPFTHAGFKIVHHSLLRWFYPLHTKFSVDIDSCHLFNILEIPFIKHVFVSHKMIYDNGISDENATYNSKSGYSKYKMDELWKWIRPSFKKQGILKAGDPNGQRKDDSLVIKEIFVKIIKTKDVRPSPSPRDVDYFCLDKIQSVFDLEHECFINKKRDIETQFEKINDTFRNKVEKIIRKEVTYKTLMVKKNPWVKIVKSINNQLEEHRDITIDECVEIYQKMKHNKNLFIHNAKTSPELIEYLRDKRVAIVGPAPYLTGLGKGKIIDNYDVVVRVQTEIADPKDYGSRTDIVQSCLNSNYGPKVASYLSNTLPNDRPKFIICHDSVARETYPGSKKWLSTIVEYNNYLKKYGVPLAQCRQDDETWDRWALYWEIYPKAHIELVDDSVYTYYSENFNSGYGSLNHLLSCPLKELGVFGFTFYNFGVVRNMKDKYNSEYIKSLGSDGTYLGPDKVLHDQISQIMHCKNVLEKDPRFVLDPDIRSQMYTKSITERIEKFKKLPKFKQETE